MQRGFTQIITSDMAVMTPAADEVDNAIKEKDRVRFSNAFSKLTAECNNCHEATGFGFISMRDPVLSPIETSPFSDESFWATDYSYRVVCRSQSVMGAPVCVRAGDRFFCMPHSSSLPDVLIPWSALDTQRRRVSGLGNRPLLQRRGRQVRRIASVADRGPERLKRTRKRTYWPERLWRISSFSRPTSRSKRSIRSSV